MAAHVIQTRIDDELWADVQREAARLDISCSQVIRQCVIEEMRRIRLRRIRKDLPK